MQVHRDNDRVVCTYPGAEHVHQDGLFKSIKSCIAEMKQNVHSAKNENVWY